MHSMLKRLKKKGFEERSSNHGRFHSRGSIEEDRNASKRFKPAQNIVSPGTLGPANRGRLLQALYDIGPSSRAELARFTGVSRGTIGGIVQPLIDQHVLTEGEVIPPSRAGGKPATKLWFSEDAKPICAVLLMCDRVCTCLVSLKGEVYAKHDALFPSGVTKASDAFQIVSGCVEKTISFSSLPVLGIGVAVAGSTETGATAGPSLSLYQDDFQVGTELTEKFGIPACVDQHARALLVGDRWFGQGRGQSNFAVVHTGEALTGALYLDGHLYRGPAGAGGEIGHTIVQLNGDVCPCGRRGCWETIASRRWLRNEAQARGLPRPHSLDAGSLVTLVNRGIDVARELLEEYAFNISVGLANLQQLVAPNCIILHGDVVNGGKPMIDLIEGSFRKLVLTPPDEEITLALCDCERVAALRGAAGLILSELLNFLI
ncbi:ROK family protein [Sinorhizobium meliloti]|uniref:ROK family protein n=1 Tax=Rhizobium meliloti TaxID=382 RepID=UPI0009B73960